MNLRLLCFDILKKVEGGSFIQNELKNLDKLDARDAALATKIVKGVFRNRIKLEKRIEQASSRPLSEIDQNTLLFILIGAYQLTEMDSIPPYAAINETVEAMKSRKMHKTAGFVNGILRTISKHQTAAPVYSNDLERLSAEYSFPLWLIERWAEQFDSKRLEIMLKGMNDEPQTNIFLNRNKTNADGLIHELKGSGVECEKNSFFDDMLIVTEGRAADTVAFKRGCLYVQDPASRLVARIVSFLASDSKTLILDAAAAPGGKSIDLLCDGFNIVSADISLSKLILTKGNFRRMGLDEKMLTVCDAGKTLPFSRRFGVVLLDAPCSACGRIRRAPEIKYRLKPGDFDFLARQQLQLLSNLADSVEEGGYLVYSTCSIDRSENEDVIEKFLSGNPAFVLTDPKSFSSRLPVLEEITNERGYIRTESLMGKMDGFFIAILKKAATERIHSA